MVNGKVKVGVNCVQCYEVIDLGWMEPRDVAQMEPFFSATVCSRCLGAWVRGSMPAEVNA
jgi:hypothetical protein